MAIRTIVVDDEKPAREEIKIFLNHFKDFEVVDECDNAFDALNAILSEVPDVVFFDIDMPGFNGIQLAETLQNVKDAPLLVFITAYSGYAVKAFELNALDYIVKPIEEKRFVCMINRIRDKMKDKKKPSLDFIIGEIKNELFLLKPQDILYLYSKKEKIFAKTDEHDMRCKSLTLQLAEDKLKKDDFFRVHKGYLINMNKVKKIIPWFKGKYLIEMNNGDRIPLSSHREKEFREKIFCS
ncbi:MAG: response regulator transcription factor [Caldisericaceae bacterium]|nr:response regulator transcription factor [Caldisericaceae bacterium]